MRRLTLNYLKTESGAGLLLLAAAALAVVIANSPDGDRYFAFAAAPIPVRIGAFAETLSLAGWVKTALMPVFFLVLGMQIKFELLRGELSNPRRLALPAAAALGGLVVPAVVFLAVNRSAGAPGVWPAAGATDLGVALAVLALVGPALPSSLRVLLMGVALADDLVALAVGAAFSADRLNWGMLAGAGVVLAALALLSRWRRAPFLFYAAGFVLVWGFVLKSGLDVSLAGVAAAFTAPIGMRRPGHESTLKYFMDSLHPYVAFAVLPLFVFTAAGCSLRDVSLADLTKPVPLGLVLALWTGKPLGVFGFSWLATVLKLARRPTGAAWAELLGVAMLCGVGLTVSLFLVALTPGPGGREQAAVRLAILAGSVLSAASGAALLSWAQGRRTTWGEDAVLGRP
ncbi:MAG: Na+/H+ antiporter NhaA [Caulobacteraceae bacterium]|nr:Na+/H+ antiporter NhaA [Caulobacteraceae bacterium]